MSVGLRQNWSQNWGQCQCRKTELVSIFLKMSQHRPLFRLFLVFSNKLSLQFLQQINVYAALGFELTTSRT